MPLSFPYYLAWICMIHLMLFAGILFFKKDNQKANRTLSLFMLILASIHVTHVLVLSGAVYRLHWLNELCFLLLYFEGPLYLQYTADMAGERINWKRHAWLHLLPFTAPLIFVVSFAFKDPAFIRAYYDLALTRQPPEAMFLLTLVTIQMTCYMMWSLKILRRYEQRIRRESYHHVMSLRWLYLLTLVLLGFSLVGVPILLAFVHSDISVLYVYMPIITMAIYLVLFYKSINFPGTEYEKKLIREMEREKISRDMHDELGAGITRIALLSEIAKGEPPGNTSQLNEISGNARQLADSLREIIWGLNPQNDTFDNLIAYVREYATGYLEDAGITSNIHFPEPLPDLHISHELRRNVCMIVKEALHNIARHAAATHVDVVLKTNHSYFSLYVTDNGCGMIAKQTTKGNGLNNMRTRTERIDGKFTVTTNEGLGTTLAIEHVPLGYG